MFTDRYIDWRSTNNHKISFTDSMLRATSGIADVIVDTCQGDSGGPLVREVSKL